MLKKTSATAGLVIVTAAGALLASSPAYALDGLVRGSSVHVHHRSHHRNRNWNGNSHHGRIFIRIYIYNKNTNHAVAVAKPERRRRDVIRDEFPVRRRRDDDDAAPIGRGAVATRTLPSANEGTAAAPASSNPAPVAPAQDSTGSAVSPSTTGTTPTTLDESTTGNVSP